MSIARCLSATLLAALVSVVSIDADAQRFSQDPRGNTSEPERSHPRAPDVEYRDDPGGPVPSGWQRVRTPIRVLYAAGAVVGPLSYLVGLLGTVTDCSEWRVDCRFGWIPVAGPIVLLAGGWARNEAGLVVTGILGGLQLAAAVSTVIGLSMWEPRLRRARSDTPSITVAPGPGSLSLVLRF